MLDDCLVGTGAAFMLLKTWASSGLECDAEDKWGFESKQLKLWLPLQPFLDALLRPLPPPEDCRTRELSRFWLARTQGLMSRVLTS